MQHCCWMPHCDSARRDCLCQMPRSKREGRSNGEWRLEQLAGDCFACANLTHKPSIAKNTSSGLRPDASDFVSDITCARAQISLRRNCVVSCSTRRKVTKEKAAPVSRAVRFPCAARLTSAAVELARCARGRPRAQTVLAETPRPSELLGATQGPQIRQAQGGGALRRACSARKTALPAIPCGGSLVSLLVFHGARALMLAL